MLKSAHVRQKDAGWIKTADRYIGWRQARAVQVGPRTAVTLELNTSDDTCRFTIQRLREQDLQPVYTFHGSSRAGG